MTYRRHEKKQYAVVDFRVVIVEKMRKSSILSCRLKQYALSAVPTSPCVAPPLMALRVPSGRHPKALRTRYPWYIVMAIDLHLHALILIVLSNMASTYYTVLYCTVLYCIVLYCTHCIVLTVLYCTALHSIAYCTVPYCTVPYCTVLYCTALYCTALCCTVLHRNYCSLEYRTGAVLYYTAARSMKQSDRLVE